MSTTETIQITLPDGSTRDVPKGTTAAQVAGQIGPRLLQAAFVARVNDELVDLSKPIEQNSKLAILTSATPPRTCSPPPSWSSTPT
jgi:threonyl-tRNA synthetase